MSVNIVKQFEDKLKRKENNISFSFGKNWQNYLKSLTKAKILYAKNSLEEFLGNVKNSSILDIGCGSGIFSYSMYSLGAKKITSFDIDPFSVECAKYLRNNVKNPKRWNILYGSILDENFLTELGKFNIVYSWGVLHHTGNMWKAIHNAMTLVEDNGLFLIAIYNKTKYSKFWLIIKKFYNKIPQIGKSLMDIVLFSLSFFILPIINLKSPFKKLKEYQSNRGMNPMNDVKDWLGGYPYEYASFNEIINYVKSINSDFKLVKSIRTNREANNTYLFKK